VQVPAHLRDASYRSAAKLGHGTEYRYAHDFPEGWVDQQYLPDGFVDATFFDPSAYGREGPLVEQWRARTNRSHQGEPPAPVE
jgi:putative ATPase